MTAREYIFENNCKELTAKELSRGKEKVNVRGTKKPMPWKKIYARIAMGQTMEELEFKYGNGRKIALWSIHDGIEFKTAISDVLDNEIKQRTAVQNLANQDIDVAKTMLEMANEYAPTLRKDIAVLSTKMVAKAQSIVNSEDCTSSDLNNISNAVQKMTDTLGHTERFGSAMSVTAGNIQVTGFDFVLDAPPPVEVEAIDVEDTE